MRRSKWKRMSTSQKIGSVAAGIVSFGTGLWFGTQYVKYLEENPDDPIFFKVPVFAATLAGAGLAGTVLGSVTESYITTLGTLWDKNENENVEGDDNNGGAVNA